MSLSPYLRSPLTDLTAPLGGHQWLLSPCGDMEMKMLDCFEAYGLDRGLVKCDNLYQDFKECTTRTKQIQRTMAMQKERQRQIAAGERSKEDYYALSPRPDSC